MPVTVAKIGDKYRVVEKTAKGTRVTKTAAGSAADGGGHRTREAAERQARAINRSLKRAGKI
jgi:hypothetical protein